MCAIISNMTEQKNEQHCEQIKKLNERESVRTEIMLTCTAV